MPVSIISIDGNVLNFQATATYFATYDLPTLQTNLSAALQAFKAAFPFNGDFYTGQLMDYIVNNVPGMIDFYVYNTTIDTVPFGGSVNLSAGYFNYISTILTNITYTAV